MPNPGLLATSHLRPQENKPPSAAALDCKPVNPNPEPPRSNPKPETLKPKNHKPETLNVHAWLAPPCLPGPGLAGLAFLGVFESYGSSVTEGFKVLGCC